MGVPPRGPKPRGLQIPSVGGNEIFGTSSGSMSRRMQDLGSLNNPVQIGDVEVAMGYAARNNDKLSVDHSRTVSLKREPAKSNYVQEKELNRDKAALNQRMIDLSNSILSRKVGEWKKHGNSNRGPVPGDGTQSYTVAPTGTRRLKNNKAGSE